MKYINPGGLSSPSGFTIFNNELYFSASDGVSGLELWKTDGTENGTVMVKDINIVGVVGVGSNPAGFTVFNGALYFSAYDGPGMNGIELWKTDGTGAGTVMVKDINGAGADNSSYPSDFTVFNGALYFRADDGANGRELWKTDGTTNGTVMVKDINTFNESIPLGFTVFNGALYFSADDHANGRELWKTDGTTNGTVMLKNINLSVSSDSRPSDFKLLNGALYFFADDGVSGNELWKTDGTGDGTVMVKDMCPGGCDGID